jgi:MoaA/NifB/PqqE/SkfB family radical SAM enzyme
MNKAMQAFKVANSFIRYKIGSPRPFFVSYQSTLQCNLRCVFCSAWKLKTHRELDTAQAKKVIDELADFGVAVLGITGGEPLIRKDLEEVAACAKRRGLVVGVNTNGTLLSPKRAKSISSVFDTVFVSLDGFEKTHDAIRGQKGAFRQAFAGLKNLVAVKGDCTVGVNFVLNRMNYEEFIPLCNWIRNLGVVITAFPVAGEDRFVTDYSIPKDDVEGFARKVLMEKAVNPLIGPSGKIIELLPRFVKGEIPRICDAGSLYFGVSPTGELKVCPILPNSPEWQIGSLMTSSMKELVSTNRFRQIMRARERCAPCLAGCTTPYSLLFRNAPKDLTKEALSYIKALFTTL